MQLVAYGAQDIYLTGNPQITFFKVVYRRHTNFAVESIEQTHNGSVAAGSKISVTVSRNGDLLSQVWLSMTAAAAVAGMETVESIIDNVECEVGGQVIDKQYGHWMKVYTDLTHGGDKATLLDSCVAAATGDTSHVPLQFWFCRNPGLALPLIALQYHEVKLNITFSSGTVPVPGVHAEQTVVATGTTGTFTLSHGGQTTPAIAHNASAADVQAAFTGLSTVADDSLVTFTDGQITAATGDGAAGAGRAL